MYVSSILSVKSPTSSHIFPHSCFHKRFFPVSSFTELHKYSTVLSFTFLSHLSVFYRIKVLWNVEQRYLSTTFVNAGHENRLLILFVSLYESLKRLKNKNICLLLFLVYLLNMFQFRLWHGAHKLLVDVRMISKRPFPSGPIIHPSNPMIPILACICSLTQGGFHEWMKHEALLISKTIQHW